jgi:hypothetical protein
MSAENLEGSFVYFIWHCWNPLRTEAFDFLLDQVAVGQTGGFLQLRLRAKLAPGWWE